MSRTNIEPKAFKQKALWLCLMAFAVLIVTLEYSRVRASMRSGIAKVEERRVLFISDGAPPKVIRLERGEILQVECFKLPVIPKYLDAKLAIRLKGDLAVRLIGQLRLPSAGEGESINTAFFIAVDRGVVTASIFLADSRNQPIEGFESEYTIEVGRGE